MNSFTGSFENVYQPKNRANKSGIEILIAFLVVVFKSYFNKLVASSGNTSEGLKVFASSMSIKA